MHTKTHMSVEQMQEEQASFITKVYGWMSFALAITGIIAMGTAVTPAVIDVIIGNSLVFYGLLIAELVLVIYLSRWIQKMSATTAIISFVVYAAINGLTFSVIFLAFTAESIASTFFITAGTFAVMSAYGYFTKRDLTGLGSLLFMGLIGLIIASIVNIFMNNNVIQWVTTYAGILIFVGLTAYDTQKIKAMNIIGNEGTDEDKKEAIIGALTLYLDFVNLFLYLLRLFGKRR